MREITVNASTDQIGPVTDFVKEQLAELDCPKKIQIEVAIVIDELFSNIIRYAYSPLAGTATIRAETKNNPLSIILTFIDHGAPFNPLTEQEPDTTALPAAKRPIGGLGLFMVRKIMDDITYSYQDGQNILTVRKEIRQIQQ